ncbi:unnamed protein product [Orchesella dallaii]|uniref:dolichyl-phosphate-mannose--protein mannosyltransferase n=1 Tax=Orchesella dallaii TaxID=48710 RepID=A0ABP1R989_9HEXA
MLVKMGIGERIRNSSSKLLTFWGQPDWIAVTASVAAFLVYLNTLKAGFVYDDSRAILTNPDIRPETPWSNLLHNDFWGTPLQNSGSHKSYRPLTTLSFRLNFLLSGLNPWPYHLTNVLLHTLTTWLFVRVARLVFCSKSCLYLNTLCGGGGGNGRFTNNNAIGNKSAGGSCQRKGRIMEVTSSRNLAVLLSSLLFALHPIHTEAVAGLVGRADVGSTAFALMSFISYVKFVKFRDKARINAALLKIRSYNSTRSHSPLCPNKNKKAAYYPQQHHHHHHYYHQRQQQHEQQSECHSLSGFGSLFTRFTNILTSFSSFLLLRMKMFVVNRDEKSTSGMTTTKGTSDNAGGSGGGYSRTKGNCDSVNNVGVFGGVSGSGLSGGVGYAVIWLWLQCAVWFVISVGFATAAMLTKEQGITILLVCAAFDLVRSLVRTRHLYQERPSILRLECVWSILFLALSSISLLYLRLHLMGPNFVPPVFSKADNSIAHQPNFWVRVGTFLFLPVFNFGLIIFPHPLSYDWSMNAIPPIQSFWELRNLVSLFFYIILIRIIYSRVRKLISSSKKGVTFSPYSKKSFRSRRDFLSLSSNRHTSQTDSGLPSGNPSSQWCPSSSWCCSQSSPSSSITSSNSSASSSSLLPSHGSEEASATITSQAPSYPYTTGTGPSRKDYCNVCHLWMSSSRKQHQHNNNNSIWNGGPEYLKFCGEVEQERDCDTSSNSSRSSSSGSSSTSSSNGNGHTGYNRLISNGHQGRSNHYRSSGNSPTASAHHQNLRYRVTTTSGGGSNISNGFGNGSPSPSSSAYLSPTGNNTMRNNSSKSFTFSSSDFSGESSTISGSSEAAAAFLSSSLLLQLSFLILPFLPATNLFFYVGFVVAERVLYMPSVGFCLVMGQGFLLVWHRLQCQSQHHTQKQSYHHHHHQKQRYHSSNNSRGQGHHRFTSGGGSRSHYGSIPSGNHNNSKRQQSLRKLFVVSVITSLFVLSLRTMRRNEDWEDEGKLYKAGIEVNPPKSWGNLGIVLSNQGKLKEAEQAYRKALHFRSNLADVHYNLGILLESQGRLDEALESYRSAIHFRPKLAPAYVNAGQVLTRLGRISEARELYTTCLSISDEGIKDLRNHLEAKTSAYLRLGKLLVEDEDDPSAAIGIYRQAVKLMPDDYSQKQAVYNSLGEALYRNGQPEEAEQWFIKALRTKPDHVPAHLTYGKMLARNKTRLLEAESWFRRAKKIAPADSSVYHHYGQFLSVQGRHSEAAESYVTAANLAPTDYDIIVGAANALRLSGDNTQAELYYKKAVSLRPQEARAHMNYGAILHVNGKYTEATKSYLTALRLKPEDDVTLMNLKKVMAISKSSKSLVLISCQHNKDFLL